MQIAMQNEKDTEVFGEKLGRLLRGGECIELVGDVGAGKTTLTKHIAKSLNISEPIQSPTFTLCNRYQARNGLTLAHYDFYRLGEAGVMSDELRETLDDPRTVTVVEWGDIVSDVLSENRITIRITPTSDESRIFDVSGTGTLMHITDTLA